MRAALLWLLTLGCAAWATRRAIVGDHVDFDVYAAAGRVFINGSDPYSVLHGLPFTYPPAALLISAAVAVVPVLALTLLEVLSLGVSGVVTYMVLSRQQVAPLVAVAVAALSLVTEPVLRTVQLGQLNGLVLGLVVADFWLVPPRYRGIATGLSAGIKLTPLVFVLVLLSRREWRGMARMGGTFAVTVAAAPLLVANPFATWAALLNADRVGNPAFVDNQSLWGLISRSAPSDLAKPLWIVSCVLVVAVTMLVLHAIRDRSEVEAVLVAALCGVLVSPIAWSHHWILAFPLAVGLLAWIRLGPGVIRARPAVVVVLVGVCGTLLAGPHWWLPRRVWETGPDTWGGSLLAGSMTLAGVALLLVALAVSRPGRSSERSSKTSVAARKW